MKLWTKTEIERLTHDLRAALENLDRALGDLPVLETDTKARQELEQLMGAIAKLRDAFDENGAYFNTILAAIIAGGKAE